MHTDRSGRPAAKPPVPMPAERPCWNCGAAPNVRCCEFGRDR